MDQSIQRHDDVLQREASVQECIFYDSILVTLLQLHRNDSDKDVAARDWIGVKLYLKRVRWCRGEEMLWEVGLVLLLQATAVCILQRAILFHANFKRPNHSNYISIETYLNGTMK